MPSNIGGYDDQSSILAEEFAPYVSDAVFIGNRVIRVLWDNARKHNEGRWLAIPLLTNKNNTATSFGQYDTLPSGPQSLYSVASWPWSWYAAAVTLDYITARLVRGPNMRVDNIVVQEETAIGSLTDLIGQDSTSQTKGQSTQHGQPLVGIFEGCDNGTTYNVYGNIARLGAGSLSTWSGQAIYNALSGIGTATNDASRGAILRTYAATTVGDAVPTHIMGHQQMVAAYMFTLDSQIRVSPGDSANPYLGNPSLLGAQWIGDNHFDTYQSPTTTAVAYNMYYVNVPHTCYRYFGEKGFDFIPWIDTPNVLEKTCRYVAGFALASDNCRLNGLITYLNDLTNL
jgi:hypothetical protein